MRTPLMDEDWEAIELMLENEVYANKLTRWEEEFLESISQQEELSEKQRERFEKICSRVLN